MKRVLKYISVLLASLIFMTNISFAFTATAATPPRANIDSPASSSGVTNSVTIKGWSINTSGVKQVTVYINGKKVGNATIGLKRDDVNRAYNSKGVYKGAATSGFSYTLNTSSYKDGTYTVKIISTGKNGSTVSATTKFIKAQPLIFIDTPKNGISVKSDFKISGWSLNPSGVKNVDVLIDGQKVGSAQTGISRADVNKVKNKSGCYKGAAQSGFSYTVKYSSLSIGTHKVQVTSYGADGSKTTASLNVKALAPDPIAHIDTPKPNNEYLTDSLTVNGWSLSADGVKSVEVFLDGKSIGLATVGQQRPDVDTKMNANNVFKNGLNSGYSLTVSGLTGYTKGVHTVKVISTGNNGDKATYESKVNKAEPLSGFDNSNYSFDSDVRVTGWALNATGINRVDLYYGSNLIGSVVPNLDSTDIQSKYDAGGLKYKNGTLSRFSFNLNINSIPSGTGTLVAKCIGNDDDVSTASATVKIEKPSPLGIIDTPAKGQNFTYNDKTIVVTGWTLNASGVQSVDVYLDDTQINDVTTGLPSDSGIINASGGRYKDEQNARFTTGPIDISNLSYDKHTIKVVATGYDGGVYTFSNTFYKSQTSFTAYNIDVTTMAAKNSSSTSIIDPDVIKSTDAAGIYEFMTLNYIDGITADVLNQMLVNCGVLTGKGQVFLDAAKTYNINPVYLVAHARVESGNGTSSLSKGIKVPAGTYTFSGKSKAVAAGTYYNQFGINAVDSNPLGQGSTYAAFSGWNSVDASIKGGAEWISRIYVWGGSPNQDTIYEMRFDPGYWDGTYKHCYEYATSKTWAHSIAAIIAQYNDIFNGIQLTFDIPQYK